MHCLEETIRKKNAQGKTALIPFLTAGYPDPVTFWPTLTELDAAGADIIEIGVPFSDPVADGPVVEAASREALQNGVSLAKLLSELKERKGFFHADIVLMGYYNPFLQYGLDRLALASSQANVKGLIVPDLPLEEAEPLRSVLAKEGIALISLVGPNTSAERMQAYAEVSQGFVYVVSVMGVTGERKTLPAEVEATIRRAKTCFSLPVALGFGLHSPSQIDYLPQEAKPDAAVFGSALLKSLASGGKAADFLERWTK
ncbi:MAG: tryptophan synthase subunit alpha [Desulfovibrionaceae bacterium]|nr:tryptophan synthase subunit alpha [Desulfovibrionaceae bacterium]